MKLGQLINRKIIKNVATTMSDYKAKMHQNRFCPRPRWRSLQHPRSSSWSKANLLLMEGKGCRVGKRGRGTERQVREGEERGEEGYRMEEREEGMGREYRDPVCITKFSLEQLMTEISVSCKTYVMV